MQDGNYFCSNILLSLVFIFAVFLITLSGVTDASAQQKEVIQTEHPKIDSIESNLMRINAKRVEAGSITIDGLLDEEAWESAEVADGFIQITPNPGDPATEQTEVRVLYDDNSIYVGARMYDTAPYSIAATLFRKDGSGYSDWISVGIDSYNDRRTAFVFAVSPRGVRSDLMIYNDNRFDGSWDAVWEAAANIDDEGWTAEMRIPLSQLRYNGENETQARSWGINFQREIARKGEESFWSPITPESSAIVSRFGRLDNIRDLPESRRLEVLPYVSSQLDRSPGDSQDPFYRQHDFGYNIGGDLKYGIGSNLTLTATINPDFGQVEVDPAVVNLTAFETFFPERRPFFMEGSEIFSFGHSSNFSLNGDPRILHTRRIGRSPQGRVPGNAQYRDVPAQTPIAGAVKLSGKTSGGWSVGMLNALTLEQDARYSPDGETIESIPVEPLSNYTVGRVQRDFRSGQTVAGLMVNSLQRNLGNEALQGILTDRALTVGLDFEQSWSDRKYSINGLVTGSYISGDPAVIEQTQRSSARYYQRPDAGHLELDPGKTDLKGIYSDLMFTTETREWLTQFRASHISPGFEVNDMGFQSAADRQKLTGLISRQQQSPVSIFRNFNVWILSGGIWNTDGDPLTNLSGVGGFFSFQNFWTLNFNLLKGFRAQNDRLTRGGPLTAEPANYSIDVNISSDRRKDLQISPSLFHRRTELDEYSTNFGVSFRYRPHQAATITVRPSLSRNFNATQYVTTVANSRASDTFGNRYVFADLDQTTVSASIRLDWTFTPDLSLQLFAQPFVSAGEFSRFKELDRPKSLSYSVYGEDIGSIELREDTDQYLVDPEGSGEGEFQFEKPDFNFRSLRGNAVLRWEFRPGSTMFLVWQQNRGSNAQTGLFDFGNDMNELFQSPASHTFLVKFSYWLGY